MGKRIQLPLQTISLTAAFMVWVLISSLLPFIKSDITLTSGQLAWITAIPVILGSLLRIPVGFLTNRYGARAMFVAGFVLLMLPVIYLSFAQSFFDLMVSGFLLGIGGAAFSIGVTALPKYYHKEKHGTVNGIYGIGNLGTALTAFMAPLLANAYGWQITVRFYLVLLGIFVLLVLIMGDKHEVKARVPFVGQMKSVYKSQKLWFFSLFYFITFGSFVAFTLYLPNFFVNQFNLDKVDAGMRTAGFIALATLIRPIGGYLSDRLNPYVVLMIVFGGLTFAGVILSFSLTMPLFTVGCLTVAACGGVGNGAVFKLVPQHFPKQIGIANGIVSAAGGLGGFFPPLILTIVFDLTGHYAIGFMALSEAALASLILVGWLAFADRLKLSSDIIDSTVEAVMVTDIHGRIETVNQAFTDMTGYTKEEAIGKTPKILSSGKHDKAFYEAFWQSILQTGHWQGEIINKRKNGEHFREWMTVSSIQDEQQEVEHFVAIFNDLSKSQSKFT